MNQHPLINTSPTFQNDILRVQITYTSANVRLITHNITGMVTYTDTITQFLTSVPIVLKINESISGEDLVEHYLPKNIPPSYRSSNFTISYFVNLKLIIDEKEYIVRKEFTVLNRYQECFDISQMIVLEQDMCRVKCTKPIKEYYSMVKEFTRNKDFEQMSTDKKLKIINHAIKESHILEKHKKVRYTNRIEDFLTDPPAVIKPLLRKFYIKIADKKLAEIHISDTFYTNRINTVRVKYLENINLTKMKIRQQEKEIQRQIEFETEIIRDVFCSDKCVEKVYELFVPSSDVFSMECFVFISQFVLVLVLDNNEIKVPIRLAKNKDIQM